MVTIFGGGVGTKGDGDSDNLARRQHSDERDTTDTLDSFDTLALIRTALPTVCRKVSKVSQLSVPDTPDISDIFLAASWALTSAQRRSNAFSDLLVRCFQARMRSRRSG